MSAVLKECLEHLAIVIEKVINANIDNHNIKKEMVTYYSRIKESTTTFRDEFSNKTEYTFETISYIAQQLENTAEYQNAIPLLSKPIEESKYYLNKFVKKIIEKILKEAEISEKHVEKTIDIFIQDVEKQARVHTFQLKLNGLRVESEPITINLEGSKIIIRAVENEDLSYTCRLDLIPWQSSLYQLTDCTISILEINKSVDCGQKLQEEAKKVLSLLLLYRVGSIKELTSSFISESFNSTIHTGATFYSGTGTTFCLHEQILTEKDAVNLNHFFQELGPKLPDNFYKFNLKLQDNFLSISFQRYVDASKMQSEIHRRIATIVSGIEALLFCDEKIEITYAFKLRGTKLYNLLEPKTVDCFQFKEVLKIAYIVRSKYTHGDMLKEKPKNFEKTSLSGFEELEILLLNFLRCLIVFYINSKYFTQDLKKEFINLIDDSFLYDDKNKDFQKLLEKHNTTIGTLSFGSKVIVH